MSVQWQYIRQRAAQLRAEYAAALALPEGALPEALPLEALADELLCLTVYEDPTLHPDIHGCLDPRIGSVRLRPGMAPTRKRFVIAHEIGHFVLHGDAVALVEDNDQTINERAGGEQGDEAGAVAFYNTRERHEQDANLFALELLVPAHCLWERLQQPDWEPHMLAATFGVSDDALRTQLVNICCLEPVVTEQAGATEGTPVTGLDPEQAAAVGAPLPTLVVAGPGTGKTRSIVAKYLDLVAAGTDPSQILALTFSNKAAEEMRLRIVAALRVPHPEAAGRVEINTFHAWGLNFLKQYGGEIGLAPSVRLMPPGDLFILLRRRLAELPLHHFKNLPNPGFYLPEIIHAISRCKDELCGPEEYHRLAEAEATRLIEAADREHEGKTTKKANEARERAQRHAGRLRELAAVYAHYETLLAEAEGLDYGDLIVRSVEALRRPEVATAVHQRYSAILVDEFQDINYASGVLVSLLDGGRGCVWAVGDPWQSIYRFRGASPANLADFPNHYPAATTAGLTRNYRSHQAILDASHALMGPDPMAPTRAPLTARRPSAPEAAAVVEWVAEDEPDEYAAIAHDILKRVGTTPLPACLAADEVAPAEGDSPSHFRDHAVLCRKHRHAAAVVATLEAHGIPVDWVGDLFDYPEVKDLLAICGLAHSGNDVSLLRALTMADHALDDGDMQRLVGLAHANRRSLQRTSKDPALVAELSPAGQRCLQTLHTLRDRLSGAGDAWQVLTAYLFACSGAMRQRIAQAAGGDHRAQRELATIGQLLLVAAGFVRQAPPHQRGADAFLAYVRLLIEAGETPGWHPVVGSGDAVRVMTIHAAKGLEFPIVYVPRLQKDQFPSRGMASSIPTIPAMLHGRPVDELQEERYLLYVAMTRARDRLVLSRARRAGEKVAERSILLPGSPDGDGAPWPVLPLKVTADRCPRPGQSSRLRTRAIVRDPIPASSLEAYGDCPRSFLYQYGYQLYDDSTPYLRMHQTIRQSVSRLLELQPTGAMPQDERSLNDLVWEIFASHEMTEVPYARDYFNQAMQHVSSFWHDLVAGTLTPANVNQQVIVARNAGRVAVRLDQVQRDAEGSQWVWTRSGQPRDSDHLSPRMILYALAAEAQGEAPVSLAIHYTGTRTRIGVNHRSDVLERHTAKIDGWLERIEAGHWEPIPGQGCATCSFNLICPV